MNSFGTNFRVQIFGESHGPFIGITIDGCSAGIAISEEDFTNDIDRRRAGAAGTTPRKESDIPILVSGVFNGHTTGAPLTIIFENSNIKSKDYEALRSTPRPGHADFVLHEKFGGFNDYRGGGHSSGRLTLCLVAAGVIAKKHLPKLSINAILTEAGGLAEIEKAIQNAIENKDSIGGIVTCSVEGMPIGIGSPFFDSLESMLAHAVFAIPAIKGIEFGAGFAAAAMKGSEHNDAIMNSAGTTATNHAGGLNGGLSNGNEITFRVAVKPTSSTPQSQQTWNRETDKVEDLTVKGRHDLCIALRVPVVVEAVTAMVLADAMLLGLPNYSGQGLTISSARADCFGT